MVAFGLCTFAIGTTEFLGIGLLPEVAADLHVSTATAGGLVSAYAGGVVVGAPLVIALGTRLARRTLLLVLMGLFVAGNVATAAAPGLGWLLAARVFTALPHGAVFGLAAVTAAELVRPERRAAAISAVFLGLTLSTLVGAPLATLAGQQLGWRPAFLGVAGLGVACLVALLSTLPPLPRAPEATLRREVDALLSRPVLVVLAIATIGFAGVFAAVGYLAPILRHEAGLPEGSAVWGLAVFGLGLTTGNLLSPRVQRDATTAQQRRVLVTRVLAALVVVLVVFAATARVPALAVLGVFLIGAVGFSLAPLVQHQLLEAADGAPTLASAAMHSAFNAGNALGPAVGGLAIGAGLGYAAAPAAGAALSATGLLIAALHRRAPVLASA